MFKHDVFIVGGGLAGCRAALEIKKTKSSLRCCFSGKNSPNSIAFCGRTRGYRRQFKKMLIPMTDGKPTPLTLLKVQTI